MLLFFFSLFGAGILIYFDFSIVSKHNESRLTDFTYIRKHRVRRWTYFSRRRIRKNTYSNGVRRRVTRTNHCRHAGNSSKPTRSFETAEVTGGWGDGGGGGETFVKRAPIQIWRETRETRTKIGFHRRKNKKLSLKKHEKEKEKKKPKIHNVRDARVNRDGLIIKTIRV